MSSTTQSGGATIALEPRPVHPSTDSPEPSGSLGESAKRAPVAGQGVARGALALLSTQPLTWAATILTTLLVPRYLGDAGLGEYSVALNVASIAGMVVALGVPIFLTRRVAADATAARREGPAALTLVMAAAVIGSLLVLGLEPYLGLRFEAGSKLLLAALVWMTFWVAQKVAASLLNGGQRHGGFALLNAACVVAAALSGIGALLLGGNATAYMATTALASITVLGVGWYRLGFRLNKAAYDTRVWRLYAIGGLPFLAWDVALQIRNGIDVVLVGLLLGKEAAGWLAAAYRIISLPAFLPTIIMITLLPVLTKTATSDRLAFLRTLRRCLVCVTIVSVPAAGIIIALAPSVPEMLNWGPGFAHSTPLMMILALDLPLGAIDMVLGTAIFALHREKRWLVIGVIGAAFNPLMNVLAIPMAQQYLQSGAIGAAAIEVLTELVMMVGALWVLPRGTVDGPTLSSVRRVVLSAAGLVLTAALVRPMNPFVAGIAGCLVYAVAIGVLRVVDRSDLQMAFGAVTHAIAARRRAPTTLTS